MTANDYLHGIIKECKKKEIPYTASFELTPFCNFRCNMCYVRLDPEQAAKQGKPLTTEQWIALAEEAKRMGAFSLEVTGGEAITRADFRVLFKRFIELGYFIVLRSNGYLIDADMIEFLKQYRPRSISVTLYGASDETYRKVCGVKNGFTVVTRNILAMKDAGMAVTITSTLTKENEDDYKAMRDWAKEHGFSFVATSTLFTPIRGAKRSIDHLRVLRDEDDTAPDPGPVERKIPDREKYMDPFWMCRHFGARFSISWDGRMTVCNSNYAIWRDPFETTLADAYHSLYRELKAMKRPKECESCHFIDLCLECPGAIYSKSGSFDKVSEAFCRSLRAHYKELEARRDGEAKTEGPADNICGEGEPEIHED